MPTPETQEVGPGNGLPRDYLPQIEKNDIPKFIRILQKHAVKVTLEVVPAFAIKPLQTDVNKEKLRDMQPHIYDFADDPFIVSDGLYLLDGHHRWLIIKGSNKDAPIRAIHVHLPISALLRLAHKYTKSYRRGDEDDTVDGPLN